MRDASRWFEQFHGGRAPDWVAERVELPHWLADLGPVLSVSYLRDNGAGELEPRQHTFAPHARPTLARTESGRLAVVGGSYNVTHRGIMDNKAMTRHDPRAQFAPMAPRVTSAGVPVHGRSTPREGAMVPRANPMSMMDLRKGAERLLDGAIIGGTCLVGVGVSDLIVERTMWGESGRAVAQGLGLCVPGAVLMMTSARHVGTGLFAAGVTGVGLRVARARQWDRAVAGWLERMMPGRPAAAREGGALWDDNGGADVRVEAVANA